MNEWIWFPVKLGCERLMNEFAVRFSIIFNKIHWVTATISISKFIIWNAFHVFFVDSPRHYFRNWFCLQKSILNEPPRLFLTLAQISFEALISPLFMIFLFLFQIMISDHYRFVFFVCWPWWFSAFSFNLINISKNFSHFIHRCLWFFLSSDWPWWFLS